MTIRVAIHHTTSYTYNQPATLSPQLIRLRPSPHNRTPIHKYSLRVTPDEHFLNWQQDPFSNYLGRLVVPEATDKLTVAVDIVADLDAYSPFDFFLEPDCEKIPWSYPESLKRQLQPFLQKEPLTAHLGEFVRGMNLSPRRTIEFLVDANQAVQNAVEYVIRLEAGVQTPEETLQLGKGSCRDSAWLLAQVLRHLGIATRFVSGYLVQLTADQAPVDGPSGPDQDFTDLHAWCECYVPGAGWVGLDPTSGLFAAEGHIPLACTPFPSSAAPIEGAVGPAYPSAQEFETDFTFEMNVERVVDRPRVTKPYAEQQWQAILKLGDTVEDALSGMDVRLSMGGEPTFVSSEFPDAPEWNTEALGAKKRALGDRLIRRLRALWAPGSVLQHGQGKWYPGEPLPRWALACYFRTDGNPLWSDPSLIANAGTHYAHTAEDAERFAKQLAVNLGLQRHGLMPAYEDAWYYMWREGRLPSNVDPLDSRLEDKRERERLSRIFDQGLNSIVGWALPLERVVRGDGHGFWVSGGWFLRRQHCFLIPGDSPMGYRLPLDSVPWLSPSDRQDFEIDPYQERAELPHTLQYPRPAAPWPSDDAKERRILHQLRSTSRDSPLTLGSNTNPFSQPLHGESATGIVRTALCVEPRDGILRIFLPPTHSLESFVELVGAIEQTARELELPIQIEGYPPPRDPRLSEFKVTPDPGVLEINIPPTTSWRALVQQTQELYEAAREEKLVAEKFDVDGTHIGSGGGNHVVLGGLTPGDSPFLRRPDVLASFIRYWHNHPSLSYLFSGRFIGPTSQAPRVDEARSDATYELELALKQLPESGNNCPPWLVDRVLRNLLVDATGNTHRTELCIDKLYSPDGPTGRLGLLELRAFEMPPHARMATVQQLLVRSLLRVFWEQPYTKELVKWGTALHDQFMLPYYCERDFGGVLGDLQRWGLRFDPAWFEPHFEFRFPRYGEVKTDTLALELRGGLEPWHVLGEESTAGGQARYVDSSLERMQVRLIGFLHERYRAVCNGVEIPVRPTGSNGEFVGGIRYRAWQPPSCLHPTIGVHSPLHVDIYDSWSERNIAGCTYHVSHPGGVSSDQRPVNAVAAESRRLGRFEPRGHQGGALVPRKAEVHPHFPHTLDLRRV